MGVLSKTGGWQLQYHMWLAKIYILELDQSDFN